jgi:hypothetical protein
MITGIEDDELHEESNGPAEVGGIHAGRPGTRRAEWQPVGPGDIVRCYRF